jgi:hypothetical protein
LTVAERRLDEIRSVGEDLKARLRSAEQHVREAHEQAEVDRDADEDDLGFGPLMGVARSA